MKWLKSLRGGVLGARLHVLIHAAPRDDYFGRRGLFHLSPCMGCVGLSWAWGGLGQQAVAAERIRRQVEDAHHVGALAPGEAHATQGQDAASGKPIYRDAGSLTSPRLTAGNQFTIANIPSRWQGRLGLRVNF